MEKFTHKVLALKYRPKSFKELIGQDILVETITNSIKLNKVPNAYLFTGIRGVGKTTTARIVAKSLNCKNGVTNLCSDKMCEHCEGITNSNHLDVLEMDAASKTGIDDIRELIESSRYNPTSSKFKIIILDEVHMLSKQAFNGLLKTLEEPPPRLKFIFATTEVKKIPLTIISRCQRFDLHRVSIKNLTENLKKISTKENAKITEEALILIAKASEGSVRDSLSLLDRAIISQSVEKKEAIDETFIRKMLGIADKSLVLNLFNFILQGDQQKSISQLREMIDKGSQPNNLLNDFLEVIYSVQQKKNLGNINTELSISESQQDIINSISENIDTGTLIVFWQLVLKSIDELLVVSNPILSLEMLVVRLIHIKEMPSYENIINSLKKENLIENNNLIDNETQINTTSKKQIKNTTQTKPILSSLKEKNSLGVDKNQKVLSFEDLINLSSIKKEIQLKYDLKNNVNLIKFSQGKIDIGFNQNLDRNFVRNLSEKLLEWTGTRWVITLSKNTGQKTFKEIEDLKKKELFEQEKKGELYKKFKNIFPDAELSDIKKKD